MTAYVFPGQGAQFTGMGKDLYDASPKAKELIDSACDILGFDIRSIMFTGSADDLKQTRVTQPAHDRRTLPRRVLGTGGRRSHVL